MYYYQKEILNKILEGKINNFFITMPRRAGQSYWINLWWQEMMQLRKKLWQEFELKYFYITNHRRYMIDTGCKK